MTKRSALLLGVLLMLASCSPGYETIEVDRDCSDYVDVLQAYAGTLSRYHSSSQTMLEDIRTGVPVDEAIGVHDSRVLTGTGKYGAPASEEDVAHWADELYKRNWACQWSRD